MLAPVLLSTAVAMAVFKKATFSFSVSATTTMTASDVSDLSSNAGGGGPAGVLPLFDMSGQFLDRLCDACRF